MGLSENWRYHYAIKKLILKKPYGLILGPWMGAMFCKMFRKKENVTSSTGKGRGCSKILDRYQEIRWAKKIICKAPLWGSEIFKKKPENSSFKK